MEVTVRHTPTGRIAQLIESDTDLADRRYHQIRMTSGELRRVDVGTIEVISVRPTPVEKAPVRR